eukprot:XP_001692538.1 predicted protein [Chlamydomonas reinhardtii]
MDTDESVSAFVNVLSVKPAQRSAEDVEQLVALLEEHPFFAGAEFPNLKVLAGYLTLQRAAPGETLLHHGELTDRLRWRRRRLCCPAARAPPVVWLGLSSAAPPVIKALSEAAALRRLPAGTILYEEHTRAESQGSCVWAAREAIKQSLALQREGLRSPPRQQASMRPVRAKAVEDEFKKWMLEFLNRTWAACWAAPPPPAPTNAASDTAPARTTTSSACGAADAGKALAHDEDLDEVHVQEDREEEEPWVRLTYLDRHFRIRTKPIRRHLEQLYGPVSGRVEPGALAGELPLAALDRALKPAQRPKRAHSAVAGMDGVDVLLVTARALRRGAEAVRSDLVAERLAVLGALEPLRGLSEEHQAAVALGAASVLGYPADLAKARRGTAAAPAGGVGPAGHEVFPADDDTPFPPSAFLATVVAARPTRLLVLSRQLLARYGYLRSALPPFAEARREALLARRGQLRAGLLLPSAASSANLSVATPSPPAVKGLRTGSNVGSMAPAVRAAGMAGPGGPFKPRAMRSSITGAGPFVGSGGAVNDAAATAALLGTPARLLTRRSSLNGVASAPAAEAAGMRDIWERREG